MAYLANQNKIFQDTVDYLHRIQSTLPASRLRNFDIPTAVDVLTTGTYQQMPTKIKVHFIIQLFFTAYLTCHLFRIC